MRTAKSENLKGFKWYPENSSFEMDDPTAYGKRDHHVDYLIHDDKVFETTHMARYGELAKRGKKEYGVRELVGAPIYEFV